MTKNERRRYYQTPPHEPAHDFEWFEQCAIPQSIQFMIDCLPAIRDLISDPTVPQPITVLDAGTRSGAGANLLATLHRTQMLGPRLQVDALDISPDFKAYCEAVFTDVREYIVGDIFQIDQSRVWDLVFCSHTIEHIADPRPFIAELQRRARRWVLLYAPFDEKHPDGVEHVTRITRELIHSLEPERTEVFTSPGWKKPGEPDSRVVLFLLPGRERLRPPNDMAKVRQQADALWAQGKFHKAVDYLRPIVKRNPQCAHAAYCLGISFALCGKYGEAIPYYDSALASGFDEYWVRYNRGIALREAGVEDSAKEDLRRAAELQALAGR